MNDAERELPSTMGDTIGQQYKLDSLGRRYAVDEFGQRIVPWSSRPPGIPMEDWRQAKTQEEKQILRDLSAS